MLLVINLATHFYISGAEVQPTTLSLIQVLRIPTLLKNYAHEQLRSWFSPNYCVTTFLSCTFTKAQNANTSATFATSHSPPSCPIRSNCHDLIHCPSWICRMWLVCPQRWQVIFGHTDTRSSSSIALMKSLSVSQVFSTHHCSKCLGSGASHLQIGSSFFCGRLHPTINYLKLGH